MDNLIQLTEKIEETYGAFRSYRVPSENVGLTDAGYLDTGKNRFRVPFETLDVLAEWTRIPRTFYRELPPGLQSSLFNGCWRRAVSDGKLPRHIRVRLDAEKRFVGFDDPQLLRISPSKVIGVIQTSLPEGLSSEQIQVARCDSTPGRLWLSLFSPDIEDQPRPGDIINGGIDIVHHLSGKAGTRVSCYLRRLVCTNGVTIHVCQEDRQLRTRRLANGRFDEADMLRQLDHLLSQAWSQLPEKIEAIKGLLQKDQMPTEYLRQQRTRFSLNDRMLNAIERAIHEDELGQTGTQYDVFNALSRVATHDEDLTFRQRHTLSRMAGEFSQQTVHRCERCGQWVREQDDVHEDDQASQEHEQSE